MDTTKYFLQFRITGDSLVPEDLTSLFSMQPSFAYKKGDALKGHRLKSEHAIDATYHEGGWLINIKIHDDQSIEKAIEDLIVQFSPFSNQIKGFVNSNEYDISLWLTAYPEDLNMHFRISPVVISKLLDMGIMFGVSIASLQDFYTGRYTRF